MIVLDEDLATSAEARLTNLRAWRARLARPPAWMEARIRTLEAACESTPAAVVRVEAGVTTPVRDPVVIDAGSVELERLAALYDHWIHDVERRPPHEADPAFLAGLRGRLAGIQRELAARAQRRRLNAARPKQAGSSRWEYALQLADERGWAE